MTPLIRIVLAALGLLVVGLGFLALTYSANRRWWLAAGLGGFVMLLGITTVGLAAVVP